MAELKMVLHDKGYLNVSTYLNSGNVIFDSENENKSVLTQDICNIIKNKFNLEIPVFVMTGNELEDVLSHSPDWWDNADKNIYDNLIFIMPPTTFEEVRSVIGEPSENIDKIEEYKNHIFWSFDLKNYRKSNWWIKTASTTIKDKITIRTANTMKKVLEICKRVR